MLAIVIALDKFKSHLFGSKILVFTDHSALKYFFERYQAQTHKMDFVITRI